MIKVGYVREIVKDSIDLEIPDSLLDEVRLHSKGFITLSLREHEDAEPEQFMIEVTKLHGKPKKKRG